MVSGSGDVSYIKSSAPKADGFLKKPITLEDLAGAVSQIEGFTLGVIRS